MEKKLEEMLELYSSQERKDQESTYNDEIRAELDADTAEACLCCIRCCC